MPRGLDIDSAAVDDAASEISSQAAWALEPWAHKSAASRISGAAPTRPRGVRAALEWVAWDIGRPLVVVLVPRQLHSTTGAFPDLHLRQIRHTDPTNVLGHHT